jgi:ABC-type branched-subunit amino acid transport system substrate-binding protein
MKTHGLVAWMAVVALLSTACGTRLGEDEIAFYAGQAQAGAPVAGQPEEGTDPGTGGGTAAPVAPGEEADGDTDPQPGQPGADPGAQNPGTGGGDGGTAPGQGGGGGADPGTAPSTDTRAAPPGGNGGATDVGVTEDRIVVYNVSDLTGAVPGLFRDAYEATLAYFTYFGATEGTVYGRQIQLVSRDSQLSGNGNRAAYLDACDRAFAGVGSMSAFEEGATEVIRDCGIPDLRTAAVSDPLQQVDTVHSAYALKGGLISIAEYDYYKEQFPDAIGNAGFVWLENQTTNFQVDQVMRGTERIGYQWNATIQLALAETNYARAINELRSKDIQIVAFQGAYQQAARLARAMEEQGYRPQAFVLQQNNYTPDLIETCRAACEDFVLVAQTGALLEEIDRHPEMQVYAEWLARVNPRARPTGLGMYAWASAKLFVEQLKEVGPNLTREAFLQNLRTVRDYDADGLIPPQNIGQMMPAGCVVILDIVDGQFKRIHPNQGYRCRVGEV